MDGGVNVLFPTLLMIRWVKGLNTNSIYNNWLLVVNNNVSAEQPGGSF